MPTKKITKRDKQAIVRAIRKFWDSLDTHLESATSRAHKNDCCNRAVGGKRFHKDTCLEYAEAILDLCKQL